MNINTQLSKRQDRSSYFYARRRINVTKPRSKKPCFIEANTFHKDNIHLKNNIIGKKRIVICLLNE